MNTYGIITVVLCVIFLQTDCQPSFSMRGRTGCVLQPVPGDSTKYRVHLTSRGYNMDFPCANGTIFHPDKCACDWPRGRPVITPTPPVTMAPSPVTRPGIIRPTARPRPPYTTTKAPCVLQPDADRNYYQEYVFGYGWEKRRCPMGTLYNVTMCACHDLAPVSAIACIPELYLNFNDKDIYDSAGTSIYVENNQNVDSVANAGRFDGTGKLTVMRYSNADLGNQLKINFRFYDFPGGPDEQVLVSNCNNRKLGSVEIAINPGNKEVIFRGHSQLTSPQEIRLPYQVLVEKAWKNVTYIYDGSQLRGRVGSEEKSVTMKGNLDQRFSGIEIGMCNGRGYVGYIDELKIYRCTGENGFNNNGNGGFVRPVPL